jgi:poly-beta-1,6-N-acetyl-D-glucosamine synthase
MPRDASQVDERLSRNARQLDAPRYLPRYVLLTAAYNEERTIERTIQSVVLQTRLPERWVIVSDGSTDCTDGIVEYYAAKHEFLRHLRLTREPGRSFGSKVIALHQGSQLLEGVPFDFIGNLDADISLSPSYFADLMAHFQSNLRLGLSAGFIFEEENGTFLSRKANRTYSVGHQAQLVRRECYEAIGGYAILEFGGEDWHAETSARMNGWEAEALSHLAIFHHRPTGKAGSLLRYRFREGRMDYSLGSDPLFEIFRCLARLTNKPFLIGVLARITGFVWSYLARDSRPVSAEFMDYLRRQERKRIPLLGRLFGGPSQQWQRLQPVHAGRLQE